MLEQVCVRFNWVVQAHCLMSNHFHLLVQTPERNLSAGMRQLNGVYTQDANRVNIVRGASFKSGPLRAIGTVIHTGRQLATAEARIVGPDGKVYAHGTTTCLVFETMPG